MAALLLLSGSAYVAYYARDLCRWNQPTPQYAFSTITPTDEGGLIAWFRQNAEPEDLVLASTRAGSVGFHGAHAQSGQSFRTQPLVQRNGAAFG